jgi:hypothetical protein
MGQFANLSLRGSREGGKTKNMTRSFLCPIDSGQKKKCTECGEEKLLEDFRKHSGGLYGRNPKCRSCQRKYDSEHYIRKKLENELAWHEKLKRKQNFVQRRSLRAQLKRFYGISEDQYNAMLAAQHGVCAICGNPDIVHGRLSVDHDHETGAVRALLCSNCNLGLGHFQENLEIMLKAIEYLKSSQSWNDQKP